MQQNTKQCQLKIKINLERLNVPSILKADKCPTIPGFGSLDCIYSQDNIQDSSSENSSSEDENPRKRFRLSEYFAFKFRFLSVLIGCVFLL